MAQLRGAKSAIRVYWLVSHEGAKSIRLLRRLGKTTSASQYCAEICEKLASFHRSASVLEKNLRLPQLLSKHPTGFETRGRANNSF